MNHEAVDTDSFSRNKQDRCFGLFKRIGATEREMFVIKPLDIAVVCLDRGNTLVVAKGGHLYRISEGFHAIDRF